MEENFEEIIREYSNRVYAFSFRMLGDPEEAEDAVQEIFLKVWKNMRKIDPQKNFKTWFFTVARNTITDRLRKKKEIPFSFFDTEETDFGSSISDGEPLADEIFSRQELGDELRKVLDKINPTDKEIILLHLTEDMTFEEISEILDKPMNTIKSRYRRALHQIRLLLRI